MGVEFNEIPVSRKKSSKLRNLLIAILLFVSILAVREVASSDSNPIQLRNSEKSSAVLMDNYSFAKIIPAQTPVSPKESEIPMEIFEPEPQNEFKDYFFKIENFLIENKSEQVPESKPTILDIGIMNLVFENSSFKAEIKNYAPVSIDDELCLNISSKKESAFLCSNFTIPPLETSNFVFPFPFSEGGYYNSSIYLNRADDNPANDNFSLQIKYGQIHDLAIDNITLTQDAENPFKINIKVRIVNNGDFNETSLALFANINNQTKEYGPYDYIIRRSRTFSYSRTFNQSMPVSATFQITNYSNFALDADEENNIKSSSIHVG